MLLLTTLVLTLLGGLYLFMRGQSVSLLGIFRAPAGDSSSTVSNYTSMWGNTRSSVFKDSEGEDRPENVESRVEAYADVTNMYYDVVTDFYEYGWGQSFHFAPRTKGESLSESIRRHQHWMAGKLGLTKGMKVLDLGCGVGGPLMEMSRFSGASVTGVNNNGYQVERCTKLIAENGLSDLCGVIKADFCHLPFEDNSIDAIYSIEAFCHAPDKKQVFSECLRVLKPGGLLASYDWAMGRSFDENNAAHVACKKGIELGNGIADLPVSPLLITEAHRAVGFEIVHEEDRVDSYRSSFDIPWYTPLGGGVSFASLRTSTVGRLITHMFLTVLVTIKLAHPASIDTHNVLVEAAHRLVEGGQKDIFTPMFFVLARKPVAAE